MVGSSRQQVDRVWKHRQNSRKRALCAGRAARQVDDQRLPERSADGAAQGRKWSVPQAIGAHAFGQALDQPLRDQPGGLRGDIPGGESGAAGGHDQGCVPSVPSKRCRNSVEIIGQRLRINFR